MHPTERVYLGALYPTYEGSLIHTAFDEQV